MGPLVEFLTRLNPANDALTRAQAIHAEIACGRFVAHQSSARLYATYGRDAEAKFDGRAEKEIGLMKKEIASLSAVLKKFPDPAKVDVGGVN